MNQNVPPLDVIAQELRSGSKTSRALIEAAWSRYSGTESRLRAYKAWNGERALEIAGYADGLLSRGVDLGPLMGIPVSVKDLYGVPGFPTFAGTGTAMPDHWTEAGPVVSRLTAQLGVIVGKTHTVEFAFGGLGVNAHWGTPVNPWSSENEPRVPGGSSSGAGVSLAQGSALLALGTDTAGSVRIPASVTGQVGLKLTQGRWPLDGIVPLSQSFDTPGLLARTVADVAFAFAALDPQERDVSRPASIRGIRIGMVGRPLTDGVESSVASVVEDALSILEKAGAVRHDVEVPGADEVLALFRQGGLAASELAAFLRVELPERIERLDPVVRARVEGAETMSALEYLRRIRVFATHSRESLTVFDDYDVLASATVAITPPRIADLDSAESYAAANMMALRNTALANMLGWCALTLPVGLDAVGMPVGLQLMARPRAEKRLLAVALAVEQFIGTGEQRLGFPRIR